MESLRFEVEPFGIQTAIVEPGFFRTELLTNESTSYAETSIDDYARRTAQTRPAWEAMSGKQTNDPAKLVKALLTVVDREQPPLRWVAGADAVATVEQKANELLAQSMPTATCRRRLPSTSSRRAAERSPGTKAWGLERHHLETSRSRASACRLLSARLVQVSCKRGQVFSVPH